MDDGDAPEMSDTEYLLLRAAASQDRLERTRRQLNDAHALLRLVNRTRRRVPRDGPDIGTEPDTGPSRV
jgi:hypothetical protein